MSLQWLELEHSVHKESRESAQPGEEMTFDGCL